MYGLSNSKMFSGVPGQTTTGVSEGPDAGVMETWRANITNQAFTQSALGLEAIMQQKLEERAQLIHQRTGKTLTVDYLFPELADAVESGQPIKPSRQAYARYGVARLDVKTGMRSSGADEALGAAYHQEKQIEELRKQYPEIPSYRQLLESTRKTATMLEEDAANVNRRAQGVASVAGFVGNMQGSFTLNDPMNLYTLPIGGFGKTVLARVGTEALTQAGIETWHQFNDVKQQREMYGLEFDAAQARQNILYAGAGGAVFRGGFEAAPGVRRAVMEKSRQIGSALTELSQKNTRAGRLAASLTKAQTPDEAAQIIRSARTQDVSDLVERVNVNPTSTPKMAQAAAQPEILAEANQPRGLSWDEHIVRADDMAAALNDEKPMPNYAPVAGNEIGQSLPALPVRDLLVDAKRFQYKSGGDESGVTQRLTGVQEWNPEMAGTISVWEARDGTRYVADGHQRTGLARRIMTANPDQNIKIPAYVYREAEGFSAEDAMVAASIKNIGENSGTPIDAAKIFRNADEVTQAKMHRVLSPSAAIVRQGRDLMKLGDDAFMMAANGVIPENYAAIVGRSTSEPAEQVALFKLLADAEPDNVFQAEQIVKQALAEDMEKFTTADLFGERTELAPLYADKAKVLDAALKQIRKERGALSNLIKNDDIVAAYGNRLDIDATQAGLDGAGWLQYIVQSQAYNKGTISELLTAAAREVRNGTRHGTAARSFVKALRERIDTDGAQSLLRDGEGFAAATRQSLVETIERERQDLFAQSVKETAPLSEPKAIEARFREMKEEVSAPAAPRAPEPEGERVVREEAEQQLALIDPDEQLPLGKFSVGDDGETVQEFMTMREVMNEIDESDALVKSMQECLL